MGLERCLANSGHIGVLGEMGAMISGKAGLLLTGGMLVASCLSCAYAEEGAKDSKVIRLDVGPVSGPSAFASLNDYSYTPSYKVENQPSFETPVRVGSTFGPSNLSDPDSAGRFRALDLSTPMPVRAMQGDSFGGEVTFGVSGERSGLGLDFELAPRAQIERGRGGNNVARTGAEIRIGRGLSKEGLEARDLRGTGAVLPSWYFFVGADNEALVWNVADKQAFDGATLRDQVTVGDLQAGIAWKTSRGGQMSFGLIERKLEWNDMTGDRDVNRRQQFAAFSLTMRR